MIVGLLLIVGGLVGVARLGTLRGRTKITSSGDAPSSENPVPTPSPLDVNSATYDQLRSIPFMTDKTVKSLIKLRPFKEWNELDQVYGIGPKRIEFLRDYLFLKTPADTKAAQTSKTGH